MTEPAMTHDQSRDLAAGHVLGALEPAEEAAVRHHLATCPEPHPEFEALGGIVPALLELDDLVLVEPPVALGIRIMAAAAADLAERTRSMAAVVPPPTARPESAPIAFPSAAVRDDRFVARGRSRTSRLDWALRIAAVIAIVAVGAWGVNLQGQLDRARAFDQAVTAVIQAAGQPGAKSVVLSAAEGKSGQGIAAVTPGGSVVIAMRDLPATSGSQVYTAWVIVASTPTAIGDFAVDPSGIRGFTSRPATTPVGATIALTLEPNAGNTAPQGSVVSAGVAVALPAPNG